MKVYFIKFLYSIIIISGVSIPNLFAQVPGSDTTKLLATVSKKTVVYTALIEDANVIFPDNLQDHKEQSLNYVEKFSDKRRDYLLRMYQTGKKYFPKIVAVLKQYQLPEELRVLIALESGFSANAVSSAGAVGYWQIIDAVAKEYGLQTTSLKETGAKLEKKDERRNFTKSTLAAVKYLRDRKLNLNNDLLLMVASYNCGVGRVRGAMKKSHKANPGFWDIKNFLPAETRNYVMNFIALNVIFENYEKFANRQLLFAPKIIGKVPMETTVDNNSIPVEPLHID